METLAAIDIGSNAIRLVIGELDDHGDIRILKKMREPVRLGKDAFSTGEISGKTLEKAIEAFLKFKELIGAHDVRHFRAIGTSALREAKNKDSYIKDVKKATGFKIEVIDGNEEGRLVYQAVAHKVSLEDRVALLIDIGGGSVELTIVDHGKPRGTQSFKLGTVRMLEMLEAKKLKETDLRKLIRESMAPVESFLATHVKAKGLHIDLAVGTGGNFECFGKLRVALLHRNSIFSLTRTELAQIIDQLLSMNFKDRVSIMRLRPDRADVVVPAALVTHEVMTLAEAEVLHIPYVGLRDGILSDLGANLAPVR